MTDIVSTPPHAETIRQEVERRLAQAERDNGEKVSVEWRGSVVHRYVISMPVDMLYYNPDTHRIRAQRSTDPARDELLTADPWGGESQAYLDSLLRMQPSTPGKVDPDYEALRESLENHGQRDPGLITMDGILVNGNTRCAALRDSGTEYIRVGVLPSDAGTQDINSVELSLQLRRDNRRDYSYINQLIAIEEQIRLGKRPEDIAKFFHVRLATLEQDRWVYALIQEAIQRSDTGEGATLALIDFESHQEKLRELFKAYAKTKMSDRDAAEQMKEARLAMILLNFAKTDLRLARPDFQEKYLAKKLPTLVASGTTAQPPVSIPGLAVTVTAEPEDLRIAKNLTNSVLKIRARLKNTDSSDSADHNETELQEMRSAFEGALKLAGRDESLRQRQIAASERITDAADSIDLAKADVASALASRTLDAESIDEAIQTLRAKLSSLARQLSRALPDERFSNARWLEDATRESGQ